MTLKELNLKNKVVIDKQEDGFYSIWTNENKYINATLAENIGEKSIAEVICSAINKKLKV